MNKSDKNIEPKKFSNEVKKHFLEIVSTYNKYQESMDRKSDISEIAETLGGITEAARELAINEADDWFDKHTVKRNMSELAKLGTQFDKVAVEAKVLDQRLNGLYEDMGHILSRYYKLGELNETDMKKRLGITESKIKSLSDRELLKLVRSNNVEAAQELFSRDYFDKKDVELVKKGKGNEVASSGMNARISARNENTITESKGQPKFKKGQLVNYLPKLSGFPKDRKLKISNIRYEKADRFTQAGWYYSFSGTALSAFENDIKLAEGNITEGRKRFYTMQNVGKAKYTINAHNGKDKHKDGSDFYGIDIFKNKKDFELAVKKLKSQGYIETNGWVNESAKFKKNDRIKVISGMYKGKEGVIMSNDLDQGRLIIQIGDKMKGLKPNTVAHLTIKECAMGTLTLIAQEAKDFKTFLKDIFKEFPQLKKDKNVIKDLEKLYKRRNIEESNTPPHWLDLTIVDRELKRRGKANMLKHFQDIKKNKLYTKVNTPKAIDYLIKYVSQYNESITESIGTPDKLKVYNSLQKGDIVTIDYDSVVRKGSTGTFKVTKGKFKVGKQKVERITLQSLKNPSAVKYYLYNRGGNVLLAIGDRAATITNMSKVVAETIKEAKHKITPQKLIANLVKGGNNPREAKAMVMQYFNYLVKMYPNATTSYLGNIIGYLDGPVAQKPLNSKLENINESISPQDIKKLKTAVEAASNFMDIGNQLKKRNIKYYFATAPLPYYAGKINNKKFVIANKKYAADADFIVGDIAGGLSESVNDEILLVNESKFKKGDIVANTKFKTIGIVRLPDNSHGEVKTDADGNVDVDTLEYYNSKKHKGYKIAPSTKREIFLKDDGSLDEYDKSTATYMWNHNNEYKIAKKLLKKAGGDEKAFYEELTNLENKLGHAKYMIWLSHTLRGYKVDMYKDSKIRTPEEAEEALYILSK